MLRRDIDWSNPINWDHPLNRGTQLWLMAVSGRQGWKTSTWRDLTQRHPGTLTSMDPATDWVTDSPVGGWGSLQFDGTDYLATNYPGVLGTSARTVSVWFRTTDSRGAGENYILSYGNSSAADAGGAYRISVENGVIYQRVYSGADSWGSGYNDGQWHHVLMTSPISSRLSDLRCFVDGVDLGLGSDFRAIDTDSTIAVHLGADISGGVSSSFIGHLSSCRFWNRTFSPTEVAELYEQSLRGYPDLLRSVGNTARYFVGASATDVTIAADSGSFSLTGQDASISRDLILPADSGSFTLSGQDANITRDLILPAGSGSFALSGQDAQINTDLVLPADNGAFTLSGQDANITRDLILPADSGSFSLTGQDAQFTNSLQFLSDAGSFTISGQDANIARDLILGADSGTFTLSGQDAAISLSGELTLIADSGSFTLSGQDAAFVRSLVLTAESGGFMLSGQDANLASSLLLAADPGSFSLTGQAASLNRDLVLVAEGGSFTLGGQEIAFEFGGNITIVAAAGSFTVNGQAASLALSSYVSTRRFGLKVVGRKAIFLGV